MPSSNNNYYFHLKGHKHLQRRNKFSTNKASSSSSSSSSSRINIVTSSIPKTKTPFLLKLGSLRKYKKNYIYVYNSKNFIKRNLKRSVLIPPVCCSSEDYYMLRGSTCNYLSFFDPV